MRRVEAQCYSPARRRGCLPGRDERDGMSVDEKTVRRIAHLARIAVTDDEVGPLQGELNAILAFVEQLARWTCPVSSR